MKKRSLKTFSLALAGLLSAAALTQQAVAADGQVIVQFKSASGFAGSAVQHGDRARVLSARLGVKVELRNGPAPQMLIATVPGMSAEALAQELAGQPEVEFAQVDGKASAQMVPNDPLFARQWLLRNSGQAAVTRAEAAWDITTGSPDARVAVLDTGVLADHPDLANRFIVGAPGVNSRFLGYDFVSPDKNTDGTLDFVGANDGDGWDADATDPGAPISSKKDAATSNWHGTLASGVIAASGNNGTGIAGVNWNGTIVPVRVLDGYGGGKITDIIAGMRWAAGLAVPGVPSNPYPVRILNMSLGANTSCSPAVQATVDELVAKDVVIIAAAGNEGGDIYNPGTWAGVGEPANCKGVMAVAALRETGAKAGYSSFGKEVDIAAPGGVCDHEYCLYQVPSTGNLGKYAAGAHDYTNHLPYHDGIYGQQGHGIQGTSFAAPLVSGAASLMLSVHPHLGGAELQARLKQSARAFPAINDLPACTSGVNVKMQCNCTTDTCGAGMLDIAQATTEALRPQARALTDGLVGGLVRLNAAASSTSVGRAIASWKWEAVSGPKGQPAATFVAANAQMTGFQPPVAGEYVVRLTVTDNRGGSDSTLLKVNAAPGQVVEQKKKGGGGAADLGVLAGLMALGALAYSLRRRSSQRAKPTLNAAQ